MAADISVVGWNVDGWHTIRDEQLDLLDRTDASIALLQEVSPASLRRLREAGWTGDSALELVDAGHTERGGATPRFACAVLVRGDAAVVSSSLVPETPSPVRALQSRIRVGDLHLLAISAALPPGSMWGRRAKVGQATALTQAVQDWGGPTLIGMDRNGPRYERWDAARTEWWPEDPQWFFANGAAHGCVDVLDAWLDAHPAAAEHSRQARPDGPRAISYVERRADPPIPRRYDVLLASTDFRVIDVEYHHQEAVGSGSDHGLVHAVVSLE